MGTSATASPGGRLADAWPGRASPAMLRARQRAGRPAVAASADVARSVMAEWLKRAGQTVMLIQFEAAAAR